MPRTGTKWALFERAIELSPEERSSFLQEAGREDPTLPAELGGPAQGKLFPVERTQSRTVGCREC